MVERLTAATWAARVGLKKRAERLQCSQKNADARGEIDTAGEPDIKGEVGTVGEANTF
jgi:hypothetical protein